MSCWSRTSRSASRESTRGMKARPALMAMRWKRQVDNQVAAPAATRTVANSWAAQSLLESRTTTSTRLASSGPEFPSPVRPFPSAPAFFSPQLVWCRKRGFSVEWQIPNFTLSVGAKGPIS